MSFSLPGPHLYYLPRDDLEPEKYEKITSPASTWSSIDYEYVFDDRWSSGFQLINMQRRALTVIPISRRHTGRVSGRS